MIEVVSIVHFGNRARARYLERSFGSFHRANPGARHLVFDGTPSLDAQTELYKRYGVEVVHMPGASYGSRLKAAAKAVREEYFLFLPDDFEWIFDFPLADSITECRRHGIDELKLTCRGQNWFSETQPQPKPWFEGSRVASGETLVRQGELYVSHRRWLKDFHEQFSLACNLIRSEFFAWITARLPDSIQSPGQAEKHAYFRLAFKRYWVAYYKMWIPAFHFIDLAVEGDTPLNRLKLQQCLSVENAALYNRLYNSLRNSA